MRAGSEGEAGFGIEIRAFGPLTAIRVEADFLRSKNRILGLTTAEIARLPEVLEFFRERGLPCGLTLPYDRGDPAIFDALVAAEMRSSGSSAVPATIPTPYEPPEGIVIRLSSPEERTVYLDLYQEAFATRSPVGDDELRFQWIEDSLPGTMRFVAEIAGERVGMASMAVREGVAYLATCGVLPRYRGRGVQQAMIRARLAAAHAAGCRLALGGGRLFSPPRRNFERCGFGLLPLGMSWSFSPLAA